MGRVWGGGGSVGVGGGGGGLGVMDEDGVLVGWIMYGCIQ